MCLLTYVSVDLCCCSCTDTPGEFKWQVSSTEYFGSKYTIFSHLLTLSQPGALAVAVMTGKLVLLEDIDKAPPDVRALWLQCLLVAC